MGRGGVYLCVSIDTECDKGPGWRCRRPLTFDGVRDGVGKRLQPMFASFGAKATYLLSPEVLRDEASVALFRAIESSAEMGTHLHAEFAEPESFVPDVTLMFQRDCSPELERKKLTYLTDLFIRAFSHQPQSFRAGRFGVGSATIGILESLGYTVESSVTPHIDWTKSGAPGLSFVDSPSQPYHPDARDPGKPGSSSILEVPLTIRKRLANALPFVGSRIEPSWLRPTWGTAESIVRLAENEIIDARRRSPGRPVVLNAMFHNVEIVPAASPYAGSEDEAKEILGRLHALLDFARRESISVVGLGDLPEILHAEEPRHEPLPLPRRDPVVRPIPAPMPALARPLPPAAAAAVRSDADFSRGV